MFFLCIKIKDVCTHPQKEDHGFISQDKTDGNVCSRNHRRRTDSSKYELLKVN